MLFAPVELEEIDDFRIVDLEDQVVFELRRFGNRVQQPLDRRVCECPSSSWLRGDPLPSFAVCPRRLDSASRKVCLSDAATKVTRANSSIGITRPPYITGSLPNSKRFISVGGVRGGIAWLPTIPIRIATITQGMNSPTVACQPVGTASGCSISRDGARAAPRRPECCAAVVPRQASRTGIINTRAKVAALFRLPSQKPHQHNQKMGQHSEDHDHAADVGNHPTPIGDDHQHRERVRIAFVGIEAALIKCFAVVA